MSSAVFVTSKELTYSQIIDWQMHSNFKNDKRFALKDGIWCINIRNQWKKVIPNQFINQFLELKRDKAGHPGIYRTKIQIKDQYYWCTMDNDIQSYVKACHQCQMVKPSLKPTYGPLIPLDTPPKLNILCAMDTIVMGSMSKSMKAKYIQTIIDHHSIFMGLWY
jgi:hypothetical protein